MDNLEIVNDLWTSAKGQGDKVRNSTIFIERSKTTNINSFEFEYPVSVEPVKYDFSRPNAYIVKITIPSKNKKSNWRCGWHFHLQAESCETIQCTSRSTIIILREDPLQQPQNGIITLAPNAEYVVRPGEHISWSAEEETHDDKKDCVVILTASKDNAEKMTRFYRTVASVMLDAQKYFTLESTPFKLCRFYYKSPAARQRFMVRFFLHIQLNVVYYENDYWPHYGCIPFKVLFTPFGMGGSRLAERLEFWTIEWISWFIVAVCYWIGVRQTLYWYFQKKFT